MLGHWQTWWVHLILPTTPHSTWCVPPKPLCKSTTPPQPPQGRMPSSLPLTCPHRLGLRSPPDSYLHTPTSPTHPHLFLYFIFYTILSILFYQFYIISTHILYIYYHIILSYLLLYYHHYHYFIIILSINNKLNRPNPALPFIPYTPSGL